ncbi:hypothetical protein Q3G72_026629 [Acer saccharum]|nr:hypothetical protein Q3G72_026629 [Acer saccharum]
MPQESEPSVNSPSPPPPFVEGENPPPPPSLMVPTCSSKIVEAAASSHHCLKMVQDPDAYMKVHASSRHRNCPKQPRQD